MRGKASANLECARNRVPGGTKQVCYQVLSQLPFTHSEDQRLQSHDLLDLPHIVLLGVLVAVPPVPLQVLGVL